MGCFRLVHLLFLMLASHNIYQLPVPTVTTYPWSKNEMDDTKPDVPLVSIEDIRIVTDTDIEKIKVPDGVTIQ